MPAAITPTTATRASAAASTTLLQRGARAATFAHELSQQRRSTLARPTRVAVVAAGSARSDPERDIERGPSLLVGPIQLRSVRGQVLHDAVESTARRDVHGGLPGGVEGVDVHTP